MGGSCWSGGSDAAGVLEGNIGVGKSSSFCDGTVGVGGYGYGANLGNLIDLLGILPSVYIPRELEMEGVARRLGILATMVPNFDTSRSALFFSRLA